MYVTKQMNDEEVSVRKLTFYCVRFPAKRTENPACQSEGSQVE